MTTIYKAVPKETEINIQYLNENIRFVGEDVESIDIKAHLEASPMDTSGVMTLSKIGLPYLTSPITKYGLLSAGLI